MAHTAQIVKRRLRQALLGWFSLAHVREAREMPWRKTRDPYAVWLSETMLQQTRAQTVVPYYERFLRELPTVRHLAEAPESRVLELWSGLGYYRRARMLQAAAKQIVESFGGALPGEVAELRRLKGIGAYTAGAVASIAFGKAAALVDGNVARVLARLFAVEDDVKSSRGMARLWAIAEELVSEVGGAEAGDWNQALMELGATVCLPRKPRCGECPAAALCEARALGLVETLPRTAPKRKPATVGRVAVVLASPQGVLLARRRADVLFGGLWEPPSGDAEPDGANGLVALASRLGVDAGSLTVAGEVVHVLSHRRLFVQVVRGVLGRRRQWPLPGPEYDAIERVSLDTLGTRAQASLARKVLAVAEVLPAV
jgi:A/G-specific adenine glycosylase